jgi:PAS domain S-box-containing protein
MFQSSSLRSIFAGMKPEIIKELGSKDIFRVLFESAAEGLVLVDKAGTILMINPRISEMFGYIEDELIGEKIEILIPEKYKQRHIQHREEYSGSPKKRSMGQGMDLSGRRKDGSTFPVEISLNYFHSGDEMVVMGLITDITDRKKIEQEFQKLNAELEQRVDERTQALEGAIHELEYTNKSLEQAEEEVRKALEKEKELSELKTRFVSTASHEFRTPLATILSSVSLIGKYTGYENEEKRHKHIERIKSSVNNLRDILNDFLSVDKLEAGKVLNEPMTFNVKALIQEILDEVRSILKAGQTLEYQHSGKEEVYLDKMLLKNVMLNLISNAIKFTEESKEIIVNSSLSEKELEIAVKDLGIGISEEDQKHLFERFFRAKNAINIQGTGLGLNIVSKYVELMDGEISFESELGKGTTFYLKFNSSRPSSPKGR